MSNVPAIQETKPDFLTTETEPFGVENLNAYLKPARLKIVQPTAGEQFSAFAPGDVLIVPAMHLVAPKDEPFRFVPLFFFPQWCLWNPLAMKGQLPMIRESSLDPQSQLAIASRNPATREKVCPENPTLTCKVSEHLNIVMLLQEGDEALRMMPILCSFARGEHTTGSTLLQMIKLRQASIFGCVFEAKSTVRTNTKGRWFGLDITNPAQGSWIKDASQYEAYKHLHNEYKKAHADRAIVVDYEEDITDAG